MQFLIWEEQIQLIKEGKKSSLSKRNWPGTAFFFPFTALCCAKRWLEIYRFSSSNCIPNGSVRQHITPEKSRKTALQSAISPSRVFKDRFYNSQFGNKLTNNKNMMTLEKTQWPTEKMAKSCLSFHSPHLEAIKHLALCFHWWCQIPGGKLYVK